MYSGTGVKKVIFDNMNKFDIVKNNTLSIGCVLLKVDMLLLQVRDATLAVCVCLG